MPEKQTATSDERPESLLADGDSTGASTDFRAENTRLRQALAQKNQLITRATPLANLALALKEAPGGAEIIRKLQAGEPLTAKEEKVAEKAAEPQALTREELDQLLDAKMQKLYQQLSETERANKSMAELHARAAKELPGYDELRKQPEWNRRLHVTLKAMQEPDEEGNPILPVPDDEPDPYWFAIKETYETVIAKHPEIGKKRVAPKTESERRGAIVKASPKAAGAPEEENVPEDVAFARRPIRRSGIGGVGKSLAELRQR